MTSIDKSQNVVIDLIKALGVIYLTFEAIFYFLPTKPFYWWLSELSIITIPLTIMLMFGFHIGNEKNKHREINKTQSNEAKEEEESGHATPKPTQLNN
jgi:hypothetical protein